VQSTNGGSGKIVLFFGFAGGVESRPNFDSFPAKEFAVIRYLVLVPAIALLGAAPFLLQDSTPAKPAAFSIPPDIAAKTNPVHPTPEGMAYARKMYGYDCAMCHGKDGDGKGDMAGDLKTPMKNYQDPAALKGMTDGELFYIIDKGKGEMPGEGDREKPDQMWNMVSLVRSFGNK
jgi:mono/diheme cytochrome c family protein